MADNVKVLIAERNGTELEFHEELDLTATNIPASTANNDLNSTDVQSQIDELDSKAAQSASPGFSFGRSGNTSSQTWLLRPGSVPSNKSGVNFGLNNGVLDKISVGTELEDTYSLEVYQHDGDEINLTLITSVNITATRKAILENGVDYTIVSPLIKNRHIAIKLGTGSAKNIGVDLQLSGTK